MECPIIIVILVKVASTMDLFLHLPWDLDSLMINTRTMRMRRKLAEISKDVLAFYNYNLYRNDELLTNVNRVLNITLSGQHVMREILYSYERNKDSFFFTDHSQVFILFKLC